MKLLRSNFYIIAMLRVRMREINQTRKKKFWRRRSHKWRGIFSLWLNCIAEDHPPFQSEQKISRRVSLTLPQPWHSNVLRVFCLFILMLVWVRLAQYSWKFCSQWLYIWLETCQTRLSSNVSDWSPSKVMAGCKIVQDRRAVFSLILQVSSLIWSVAYHKCWIPAKNIYVASIRI